MPDHHLYMMHIATHYCLEDCIGLVSCTRSHIAYKKYKVIITFVQTIQVYHMYMFGVSQICKFLVSYVYVWGLH